MTRTSRFFLLCVVVVALLLPPITRAGAPQVGDEPVLDVFVQVGGVEYQCYPVIHTTTEAPHETTTPTEIGVTYEPPPTFTPSVRVTATPTPDDPTPTPEAISPTPTCHVMITHPLGLNKRTGAGVIYKQISTVYTGQIIEIDSAIPDTAYLWGRDRLDGLWFALQPLGGPAWVTWGDDCGYPYARVGG